MMANKHLHELLKEDQEPFLLKDYIADRRSQLRQTVPKTSIQPKKRKPIVESSTSKRSLCKQACFFSFVDSPDVRKSPFFDFPSPVTAKSPCISPNTVLLHIPARTAAMLLEAAMRIQKPSKERTQAKNVRFGLFGSILKRLSSKNQTRKCEIAGKSAPKTEKMQENLVGAEEKRAIETGFSCSCSNSRRNSTVWSESNEDKSLDTETSSSSRSDDSEETELERESEGFASYEKQFCSSPMSPFRFALQHSPSPGLQTPVFSSPATSPIRHSSQEKESCEVENVQNIHLEEDEEKEQCSPVSVLDPRFEDDEDGNDEEGDEEEEYNIECSYAIVQRAKQQLLQKLQRFEKLAELDPIELEKSMFEIEEDDEDENADLEYEEGHSKTVDMFINEILSRSGLHLSKVPADMKRLMLDLMAEEKRQAEDEREDYEAAVKRVCKRLDSWKEVQSNTIDMMVEFDLRRELDGWRRNDKEQVGEAAMEIELAIFGLLVEELSEELVCLPGQALVDSSI
ncbi:hypothetical protein NMG60_11001413 [Bertholletia excelsa]